MGENSYTVLVERIREHCRQQHWYGPEGDNPARYNLNCRRGFDAAGNMFIVDAAHDPLRSNFAYPPASAEQLAITEQLLGFPLPSLLRTLYSQLANGGFGPGDGIIGASGGFPLHDGMGEDIAHGYLSDIQGCQLIKLTDYELKQRVRTPTDTCLEEDDIIDIDGQPIDLATFQEISALSAEIQYVYEFPLGVWPDRLLPLCYWGCGIGTSIDARGGQIFQVYAGEHPGYYIVEYKAPSLQAWLERWLQGYNLQ